MPDIDPTFTPRALKDGSAWCVVVDWPNGNRLHVNGFADEAEAKDWAGGDRHDWLARVRIRPFG
jgi:hypothetical protein